MFRTNNINRIAFLQWSSILLQEVSLIIPILFSSIFSEAMYSRLYLSDSWSSWSSATMSFQVLTHRFLFNEKVAGLLEFSDVTLLSGAEFWRTWDLKSLLFSTFPLILFSMASSSSCVVFRWVETALLQFYTNWKPSSSMKMALWDKDLIWVWSGGLSRLTSRIDEDNF